ncbi:putative phosphoenolpyruvate synthase [Nocardia nova SH22a]|uniref:Rifampicin phosphotransferase n=1 Tax=Nocardia nova SH22a TaxID=1415166 RepID=W5TD88_9NOCA|nr:rifamycin-inactivating phosphotransferase [Nocardia nova]AHH16913.1 putative phosphoenolpyruvate synthase [Nocardia nova SH22a]
MGCVLGFGKIDRAQIAVVGGKGANLGELSRVEGVAVPDGFCVTTEAFARVVEAIPGIAEHLDGLARLEPEDRESIRLRSAEIRRVIEECEMPGELAAEITEALAGLGENVPCAVRSSATAEDLPTASFAGQQDSYLNIVGPAEVLRHVGRCWASLFTERAVTYRLRNGFDHRKVRMAVVVQRMVFPRASGILVTADPLTSNRKLASVDAGFGLGEALVSGLVNADVYTVRDDAVVDRAIATKERAIVAAPAGGTRIVEIEPQRRDEPVLTDAEVVRLVRLGRRIEAHFGTPQDIEWCWDDGDFRIVQSRPITTLFPIPEAADDNLHIYISVGHQQMMTDAMKPLGLSFWKTISPGHMRDGGGRLFVDATPRLAVPEMRDTIVDGFVRSDPLTGYALRSVLERPDLVLPPADQLPPPRRFGTGEVPPPIPADPAVVAELIAGNEASVDTMKREIRELSGPALLDFIAEDIHELHRVQFNPRSLQVINEGMDAAWWLNDQLEAWLGEKNAADVLTQSVPNNVTSEMGLALLDVADAIRPHPDAVAFLRQVDDEGFDDARFLDELGKRTGGAQARAAIEDYLDRYGMRCTGEIDITRPRWSESPTTLVPAILGNIRNFEPGAAARLFEEGRRQAERTRDELLARLRELPDGEQKAEETARKIDRVRTFAGYREYPKYAMVTRYLHYKRALLAEAERLVAGGVLGRAHDIFYLTLEELGEVVRSHRVSQSLIEERRAAFRSYRALTAPRVLTSDGETFVGSYGREDIPAGALAGMGVSPGAVEGRARVVTDLARADLEPGDILVTAYTDPSWTPLFVAITGLVTEVGGLMTHGAVIAREYGLPAVVGVQNATRLIRDGQRIRVHGQDGYVEILSD